MNAIATPSPFPAAAGFTIQVQGGVMPIEVVAYPSPPNPPGVKVLLGPPIRVTVPPGTPPGTQVSVQVSDSSVPPQSVPVTNTVA